MSFQQKCLERMRENVRAGVTLVFVSHNLQAVAALCKRALVCGRGRLLFDGPTEQALTVYLQAAQTTSTRGGTDRPHFRVLNAALKTRDGRVCHTLRPHTECQLTAQIECFIDAEDYCVGIELERTRDLLYCYGTTSEELGMPLRFSRSGERLTISIDFAAHLTRGHYRINLNIRQPRVGRFLLFAESVADFVIEEHETYDGVVDIEPRIALSTETAKTNYVQPATIA